MEHLVNIIATIVGGFGVHILANPKIRVMGGDGSRLPEIIGPVVGVLTTLPFVVLIDHERKDASRYGWIISYLFAYTLFGVGVLLAYFYQETSE